MKQRLIYTFCLFAVFITPVFSASLDSSIKMAIGLPQNNAEVSGVATINGWTTSPTGIDFVELQIDGDFVSLIPIGEKRQDVNNIYPSYPGSLNSGFSARYNFSTLSEGEHDVTVLAVNPAGDFNFKTATITVTKYKTGWAPANEIDLSDIVVDDSQNKITLRGVKFKGTPHVAELKWDQTIQNLAVTKVEADPDFDDLDSLQGNYVMTRASLQDGPQNIIDTEQPGVSANATMTITNSTMTQSGTVTINGQSVPLSFSGSYTDKDFYIQTANSSPIIVARGNGVLITSLHINVSGADLNEVDTWVKTTSKNKTAPTKIPATHTGLLGGLALTAHQAIADQ